MFSFSLSKNGFLQKINSALSSFYLVPTVFAFALLCYIFNLEYFCVITLASLVCLILLFCKDIKNIFAIIIYACFYIGDIALSPNWLYYGIAIFIAVISFSTFTIYNLIKGIKTHSLKKGKLYPALMVCSVAFCLAGAIGNFQFVPFIITAGFCIVAIIFYFLALNFTKDLSKFLLKTMIVGAVFVAILMFTQNLILYLDKDELFPTFVSVLNNCAVWVGAQNRNVASLFMMIGLVSCFFLARNSNWACLLFLTATMLLYTVLVTVCRFNILLSIIIYIVLTVEMFISYKNKQLLLFTLLSILLVAEFLFILDKTLFMDIIERILNKSFGENGVIDFSGRTELWKYCYDKFLSYPILGYGFIGKEKIPFLREEFGQFVLAHNTLVQWLCSLGIVGCVLMCFFYFKKYSLVFSGFKNSLGVSLVVIMIGISGLFDQAPAMDIFVYLLTILCLSATEKDK